MKRYLFFIPKRVLIPRGVFVSLLCILSTMATGCNGRETFPEKTITTSVAAANLNALVVSVPDAIHLLDFEIAEQSDISIEYKMVADEKGKLPSTAEDILAITQHEGKPVVFMPESGDCEILPENETVQNLSNLCTLSVTVTLPAGKKIDIYEASSGDNPSKVYAVNLAWPKETPQSLNELATVHGEMHRHEYRLMVLERWVASGGAKGLKMDALPSLLSMYGQDGLEVVAEPLRASYGGTIPSAELDDLLRLLNKSDRDAITSLLSNET